MHNKGDNITYSFFKDKLNRVIVPDEVFTAACQGFIFERNKRRKRRFFYWLLTVLIMMALTILGIHFFTRSSAAWRVFTSGKTGSVVINDSVSSRDPGKFYFRDTAGYNRKQQTRPVSSSPEKSGKILAVDTGDVSSGELNDSAISKHSLGFDIAAKKDTATVVSVKIRPDSGFIQHPQQKKDSLFIVW